MFKKKFKNNKFIIKSIYSFITEHFIKFNKSTYILSFELYKKLIYNNNIKPFVDTFKTYYLKSKSHFLDKYHSYNGFLTIIRQLTNEANISYTYKKNNIFGKYYIQYTFII